MNSGALREGVMDAAGIRSPYLEAGPPTAEEAAAFIHGNPGSARDWQDLVSSVGSFGRAVALDMPGYGRADKPKEFEYTVDGYARHLHHCLNGLAIRRVHLIVHDFGGPWGLDWAATHVRLYRATDPSALGYAQARALRPLDRPALVNWGKRDPYLPFWLAERQRDAFPSARLVVLPNSGHFPFADDPQAVRDAVLPFLRQQLAG